ncbi:hypothetical protein [Sanguibacter sp. HDW7]|uniref:hypothetical protein n=1 Tax=Sanguibacter sp. HDW7 TaxID=2714931 RepID=UPI0014083867|nr:hypothetical protein [Sanguibacter sp. HDW7]QIK82974.1 hypothetical protein G7063_04545 [Sanguibacter sp. HDW7]
MHLDKRGRDYSALLVTHPVDGPQTAYERPRRALVTAPTYAGDTVTLELDVTARAHGMLCVEQHDPTWGTWHAWVPAEACEPLA